MTGTTLIKIFIIILCMNILLYVGGVRVLDTTNNYMGNFVTTSGNQSNVTLSSNLTGSVSGMSELGKSGGGLLGDVVNFIDSLGVIGKFIIFIVNITVTPFGLFVGLPYPIPLLIGLPFVVISIFGIAYFIRSGN